MQAIILAGGKGARLLPYTLSIPKPLLPVDDMPILEVILRQLKYFGFKDVVLSVNYLADLIKAVIKGGERLGINITYSMEEKALGTVGPISLIDDLEDTFLLMNGDLLTNINYLDFFNFHKEKKNVVSIATFKKKVEIDFGVIKSEKGVLQDYVEKPAYFYDVSMGIYIFDKSVLEFIPKNERMDLPELITILKNAGKKVGCYSNNYDWLDIGKFNDYEKAMNYFRNRRGEYLPHEENTASRIK